MPFLEDRKSKTKKDRSTVTIQECEELPYFEDSTALFFPWADRPWSVFLDSGFPHNQQGRYDILSTDPITTLVTRGDTTEIRTGTSVVFSPEDPFTLVQQALDKNTSLPSELPFCGGAIGYFSYDLARRLERLPTIAQDTETIPEMVIGIYEWAVVVDHQRRRTFLVGQDRIPPVHRQWLSSIHVRGQIRTPSNIHSQFRVVSDTISNLHWPEYQHAFRCIQRYIHEGDCYQVNLTRRFSAYYKGNPWTAYCSLKQLNPAPFSAYLHFPQVHVLSSSPERFLNVVQHRVETKPIKGTRPRSNDPFIDREHVQALQVSLKDRAENVMIVDLLRNDLGKNCVPGSVEVPHLFEIESYATVHHLVSTIHGQLAPDRTAVDLLRGCFPGGSITGAPKVRAMEIIEELEPHRRGVYCGSIAYVSFDGQMDSSIAIRTLVCSGGVIRFWAGGGIVTDSEVEQEYQECYHKASAMQRLLERFRVQKKNRRHLGY